MAGGGTYPSVHRWMGDVFAGYSPSLPFTRPLPELFALVALTAIRVPTLTLYGGKSPSWLHHAAKTVAGGIPGATSRQLPGQDHNVAAKAVAPVLREFFAS